jgi:hypothetical protein
MAATVMLTGGTTTIARAADDPAFEVEGNDTPPDFSFEDSWADSIPDLEEILRTINSGRFPHRDQATHVRRAERPGHTTRRHESRAHEPRAHESQAHEAHSQADESEAHESRAHESRAHGSRTHESRVHEAARADRAERRAMPTKLRNKSLAFQLVSERSWSPRQFRCLDRLWTKESNWNHRAVNHSSGAYGIPQALPASKMRRAGRDWRINPETQIKWGLKYIRSRYGTPCAAWAHSRRHGWY